MSIKLRSYRTEDGVKPVLVNDKGHKNLAVLMMGEGQKGKLTVRHVPKSEERYMTECHEAKKRRNLNGAIRVFASYGRNVGATKEAKAFLREARS
jgi:hypothetical protein